MSKPKLNVKLIRKIQKHITEEPRRFFMDGYYFESSDPEVWKVEAGYSDIAKTMPPCGTAACIAGWANTLSNIPRRTLFEAAELLGINPYDYDYVFIHHYWPQPFSGRYNKARTPKTRAKIACERLDYLIETGL